MMHFKPSHVMMMVGLIAPLCSNASDYCIATNGGWHHGGSSFIGKGFTLPAAGNCMPWSGFVKTATTVIAISTGTGCRSTDGLALELTISSTDPAYLGSGVIGSDHIKFCPEEPLPARLAVAPASVSSATDLQRRRPATPRSLSFRRYTINQPLMALGLPTGQRLRHELFLRLVESLRRQLIPVSLFRQLSALAEVTVSSPRRGHS